MRGYASEREWLTYVDDLVAEAAPEALPLSEAVRGFDGDAWVWIWRERLEMPEEAVAQVTLAVRPDSMEDGAEASVVATAWLEERREIAWSRTFLTRYLDEPATPDHRALLKELRRVLAGAWDSARKNSKRLPDLAERRETLMAEFAERGLLRG